MNCLLRKFILKKVNEVLKEKKTSIEVVRSAVSVWQSRAQALLDLVSSLKQKLDDNKIDDAEIEAFAAEVKKFVEEWK